MATDDLTTEGPADTPTGEAAEIRAETAEGSIVADRADETVDAEEATEVAADVEEPPGPDPEDVVDEQPEVSSEASGSGTPGIPPPVRDDRRSDDGLPLTTTTGDPDKDFRGPSVTEEARRGMEEDAAMDEPGFAELGHAEDYHVMRDD
jgi:hypothetical protein